MRPSTRTPAATIAAEWRYAETGVGAAMARGSQKWSGVWALLAIAATAMRTQAHVVAVLGVATARMRATEKVPYSALSRTAPINMPTALPVVTISARIAAPRASLRPRSKPIRKYDATAVRSKNRNIRMRSWLAARPTIAPMKRTIHAQKRRASAACRPPCSRCRGM